MKYLIWIFLALTLLSIRSVSAQEQIHCGTSFAQEKLYHSFPELLIQQNEQDELIRQLTLNPSDQKSTSTVLQIPVVVHIIHLDGTLYGMQENLPDYLVRDAIQDMNDALRNVGFFNPNTGVDTQIEAVLAQRDPEGEYTNGILRAINSEISSVTGLGDHALLLGDTPETTPWDTKKYCNIWVVPEIKSREGYTYFPAPGYFHDGIYLRASLFRNKDRVSKIMVHELGHYLNLYHTWEGGCQNNDCLSDGDHVCDTPPDNLHSYQTCGVDNSCNTDTVDTSSNNPFYLLGDQLDMDQNYMDYSELSCWDRFTQGQKDRMRITLNNIRPEMISSQGAINPGIPAIHFEIGELLFSENSSSEENGNGYADLELKMEIGAPPVGDAIVTLNFSGTSTEGKDFSLQGPPELVFPSGSTAPQTFTIRIWNNKKPEPLESIVVNFKISGNTDAEPANFHQTMTINILGEAIGINQIYPNPVSDLVNVELFVPKPGYLTVELFDLQGKKHYEKEHYQLFGVSTVQVQNLNRLPPGIYFIRTTQDGQSATGKILIH